MLLSEYNTEREPEGRERKMRGSGGASNSERVKPPVRGGADRRIAQRYANPPMLHHKTQETGSSRLLCYCGSMSPYPLVLLHFRICSKENKIIQLFFKFSKNFTYFWIGYRAIKIEIEKKIKVAAGNGA